MYFDYFHSAVYINLDCRPERRFLFEQRTQQLGISIPRFSAITIDKNDPIIDERFKIDNRCHLKIGCNFSHIAVIKLAEKNNLNNILIFEDDCVFDKEFVKKLYICIDELKCSNWDIFYMGGEPNAECLPFSENLRLCSEHGGVYGTHAYAVNHTFYNRISNLNPVQPCAIDILYMNQPNRIYVITKELLATQDDVESDLWGGTIKRTEQYRKAYRMFIK